MLVQQHGRLRLIFVVDGARLVVVVAAAAVVVAIVVYGFFRINYAILALGESWVRVPSTYLQSRLISHLPLAWS